MDDLIVDRERLIELEDGYRQMGIPQDNYPRYDDPHQLASSFEICSLYKFVTITADSCVDYSGSCDAELE